MAEYRPSVNHPKLVADEERVISRPWILVPTYSVLGGAVLLAPTVRPQRSEMQEIDSFYGLFSNRMVDQLHAWLDSPFWEVWHSSGYNAKKRSRGQPYNNMFDHSNGGFTVVCMVLYLYIPHARYVRPMYVSQLIPWWGVIHPGIFLVVMNGAWVPSHPTIMPFHFG